MPSSRGLHGSQRTDGQQTNQERCSVFHQMDEIRHQVGLLAAHQVGQRHNGFTGAFRTEQGQNPSPHTLHGGEDEQSESDAQGGSPHLLHGERFGVLVGKGPHGERR